MHMQLSLRASILSTAIPAKIRLGFDRSRAREMQWLFTNLRIAPAARQHVMDSLFGFAEKFDVYEKVLRWDIPLTADAVAYAERVIPQPGNTLIIGPCSSHPLRNWRPEYYAEVADYAIASLGMRVILCGGPSDIERRTGERIVSLMKQQCENTIGQDTLLQFFATLGTRDGLDHARLRSRPHGHRRRHPGDRLVRGDQSGAQRALFEPSVVRRQVRPRRAPLLGKPAAEIPWTTKIERPGVMDLITPDDVIKKMHALLLSLARHKKWALNRRTARTVGVRRGSHLTHAAKLAGMAVDPVSSRSCPSRS